MTHIRLIHQDFLHYVLFDHDITCMLVPKLADGTKITHAQNDARYIERGRQLALTNKSLDDPQIQEELRSMNKKKNGHPYEYPDSLFVALALVRSMCGLSYRVLEGLAAESLGKDNVPHFTKIRTRILALDTDKLGKMTFKKNGNNKVTISILPDGTGLEPCTRGEFIRAKHKVRRGFIRFTTIIDHDTMKILAYEITDERTGEAMGLENMIETALENLGVQVQKQDTEKLDTKQENVKSGTKKQDTKQDKEYDSTDTIQTRLEEKDKDNNPNIRLLGDGLYSKCKFFDMCDLFGIELVSPVASNSAAKVRGRKGGRARKKAVLEQLGGGVHANTFATLTDAQRAENMKKWKKQVGYGRRWLVEIMFSAFKRMFGSAVMAVKMENIVREISFKVFAYNKMLDIAQEAMARA